MNIAVIGTGYVGLVTGTIFADLGNDVICVDLDPAKVEKLSKGIPTIYEPGLEDILQRNVRDGRMTFTTSTADAVKKSSVVFIAVGTPPKDDGETDLSQVEAVATDIAKSIDEYKIIVNKSTVPVGTGDFVRNVIRKNQIKPVDFDVVSNPEFLREGSAILDSLEPDRVVIGSPSKAAAMALVEIYAPLECPVIITDVESAEVIKYASNAFLSTKISFINAIADLCEKVGADVTQVAKGMGRDQRIGAHFLNAGLGYGGSCFPKDTVSLIHTSKQYGVPNDLLDAVVAINDRRVPRFCERIEARLGSLEGKTIGMLGLAFKPNTDDMREAKSLEIARALVAKGAKVRAYDPVAAEEAKKLMPELELADNAYATAEGCDALVLVTEWREFKQLNLERLRASLKQPIVFDGRNVYSPEAMKTHGFEYFSIGRKTVE